ncbi:hypothetical protein IFM89_019336 [Coptis chinensis]|uniref:F-box domain-containing protein n=1 Tax=Coptis chinensis TaxID=261450 RepID=A0A835I4N6_9MAGN|nr:hypothetical protein IFM89_019336 [Coptis chinensis]
MEREENKDRKLVECKDGLFSKLPSDIIFDILSRLPLKTISHCRWVSKKWYNLVLHPCLAELHFARNNLLCAVYHDRGEGKSYLIDPECFINFETSVTAYDLQLKGLPENFGKEYRGRCPIISAIPSRRLLDTPASPKNQYLLHMGLVSIQSIMSTRALVITEDVPRSNNYTSILVTNGPNEEENEERGYLKAATAEKEEVGEVLRKKKDGLGS